MMPAGVLALSLADRQALVPMAAGYLVLMSALGFGLYRSAPSGAAEGLDPGAGYAALSWLAERRSRS